MSILVIGEKPSVSKELAKVLGADKNRKNGYTEGNGYTVSWCYGHLVGLLLPNEYGDKWAKWDMSALPMLPDNWQFKIKKDCEEQFAVLKKLMSDSSIDEIICATDADREGECIFRYVYNLTGCKKPVKRLWISSLEEKSIKDGMNKLKDFSEYDNLYAAGFCRAKSDWLVGMNASRLFSMRYNQKLNIGRVQTPTLAMIVKRDYEVKNFVKQKYFTVELDCGEFTASSERIDDEAAANALVSATSGKNAVVSEVKKEIKTVNPPKLYDLTTLQRDANKKFGYTAKQTLDYLQLLYEGKLSTYPRTDSQYLTEDMKETAMNLIDVVAGVFPEYGKPENPDISRCINNAKVTGHHAILPTEEIAKTDLSAIPEGQRNILRLISSRLLLAASEPHKYEAVKAVLNCERTDFKATGHKIVNAGWKELEAKVNAAIKNNIDNDEKEEKTVILPELREGQIFENVSSSLAEHWTSPPKPYTEDTLLSAMEHAGNDDYDENDDKVEKKGLGTPATRAGIIENLVINGYAERKKKQISATDKGATLISVVPDEVKSPKLTAEWEMQLQRIERNEAVTSGQFMTEIVSFINSICQKYGSVDSSVSFAQAASEIGTCPKCGKSVLDTAKAYSCCGGKNGCGFIIWKSIAGKTLSAAQAKKLLSKKKTDLIKGFKSKAGKDFNAYLVLKADYTTGFEFENKK